MLSDVRMPDAMDGPRFMSAEAGKDTGDEVLAMGAARAFDKAFHDLGKSTAM